MSQIDRDRLSAAQLNAAQANAAAAHAQAADPMGGDTVHRPADDREEVYYEGSPLLRGEGLRLLGWGIAGIVLIFIPIVAKILMPRTHIPWWVTAALVVLGLILLLIPMLVTRSIRYRVSNYRVDFERGFFSKTIDTLELWHVEDIKFHQSFYDRIVGVGDIEVISHDDTTPQLLLKSVPNSRSLFETLKQRIISVKRQRGVLKMDSGT